MNQPNTYSETRQYLHRWQQQLQDNLLIQQSPLMQRFHFYFNGDKALLDQLQQFAARVAKELEPIVIENNLDENLPRLNSFNAVGDAINQVVHHPSYTQSGDIIYSARILERLTKPGGMLQALSFFLLSSHAGEAGHNCPIACSSGVIRILQKTADFPGKENYLKKLIEPSFSHNYTGAQFLTEIQGGSDVGSNAAQAYKDKQGQWRIRGEKWFCSNANAELILMTARFDETTPGSKGLGLFLVPKWLDNGDHNHYHLRRLKEKLGTRSMATAEIDFNDTVAIPMGEVSRGINLVMENVLHLSRIFNAFSVLGMARRAYQIAYYYAENRQAFGDKIINYPLVQKHLARIKVDNEAMQAAAFAMVALQDKFDSGAIEGEDNKLLLRLLANIHKYFTAKRSVENIHHCLDILAGNGTIESFSTIPRLLRDTIVCENWEGTHYTLWMQILRDMNKSNIHQVFIEAVRKRCDSLIDKKQLAVIQQGLTVLEAQCEDIRSLEPGLQTLKLEGLIQQMAIINCSLCLAMEINQEGVANSELQACLNYFNQCYGLTEPATDAEQLILFSQIYSLRR